MIEEEILTEIKEDKLEAEGLLFPKDEWDELKIHWSPVSNIPVDEIYKDLPEVKQYHENYVRFWLTNKKGRL